MALEILGMVGTKEASEIKGSRESGGAVDADYLRRFAEAHEAAGFDRVLIGYGATSPDGWAVAAAVLFSTERLRVLIAHRPGFVQPTLVARKAATLDNLTGGGRVAIHFITGGDESDQVRDGDYVAHDDRYRRTAEYMGIIRQTLTSEKPFDHNGEFYRYEGAYSTVKPATALGIPLYFGGASAPAVLAGAANADVYMLWGEPRAAIAERIAEVRGVASSFGRSPRFSLSVRPIVGPTEEAAWARAEEIADLTAERVGRSEWRTRTKSSSVGSARLQEFATTSDVHDERLWTKVTALTGPGGNSTALVGTAEQVAESILRYHDLGVTSVLIRGFDPLEDVVLWGKELVPLLREGAATRELSLSSR
jgi:alkanesulfonate monooxygenase